jgi:hypothetical protein
MVPDLAQFIIKDLKRWRFQLESRSLSATHTLKRLQQGELYDEQRGVQEQGGIGGAKCLAKEIEVRRRNSEKRRC